MVLIAHNAVNTFLHLSVMCEIKLWPLRDMSDPKYEYLFGPKYITSSNPASLKFASAIYYRVIQIKVNFDQEKKENLDYHFEPGVSFPRRGQLRHSVRYACFVFLRDRKRQDEPIPASIHAHQDI